MNKISLTLIGFLGLISVAQANMDSNQINLEGRVVKATGLEAGREGQPCVLTIQAKGRKEAAFYFGVGENLAGSHNTNAKRFGTDYVYIGPEVDIGNHGSRQEQISIDVQKDGQGGVFIRRIFEKNTPDTHVIFKLDQFDQRSEVKCKLKAADLGENTSVQEVSTDDGELIN